MPSLLVKEGPLAGQRLDVDSVLVLGRSDADVVIDDPEMTRRHAVLRCADGVFEIEDLDSLNGTFLNGTRIKGTAELVPGDVVRLGKTVFEVETAEARDASAVAVPPEAPPPAVPPLPTPGLAAEPLQPPPARLAAPAARLAGDRCLGCGAELTPNARFCSNCGVAVDAPEPTTESQDHRVPAPAAAAPSDRIDDELRPVTALFADVVGSTSLGERLPPDEVKELIGECVNLMSRAVEQFGGSIQSYMGDGIAAFFGLPTAHEDDPERAAHAAIRILEVVAEYSRDIAAAWGVEDFNVRVGVNSGQTAVGAVGAAEQQIVALGDATNVAARLQSAAAPGTIVVGESTARRLAHRFVLESLGELSVKGRAQAVGAWRLASVQVEARAPAPTPLVGRDAEVSRLRSGVEVLTEGRGQLLLLVGEAGIGKTRLLAELRTIASDRALWLEGHCRSYGVELLYWPFVEMLRSWLAVEEGEAEVSVRMKLRAKLTALEGANPVDLAPRLGRLLGVRVDDRDEHLRDLSPEAVAKEIERAYAAWVQALSARQPVIMVIDDLQWADPAAVELAKALLEVTDRTSLLIAAAFRADIATEGSRFRLYALEHYAHRVAELLLEPLSDAAAAELLGMLVPEGLDADAAERVIKRAEGNPLFLEELLRSLIEGGGLERRQRTWALTRAPAANLPPALEGLLIARFDGLPEGARRLAQTAAVVGRTFPVRVLEQVARSPSFDADLAVLLRAQSIRELRRYPELVYVFKHGLLQQAALSTLTPTRREELYGLVAAVFEQLYAGSRDEHLEVLASYYARSRNRRKALEYLELAGARAASLNANAQALEVWNRARKVAEELQDAQSERRIAGCIDRLAVAGTAYG